MIEYRKGDMFEQDREGKIFVHACNCQGVWGSGIAKVFAEKYPQAYQRYRTHCLEYVEKGKQTLLQGTTLLIKNELQYIGCLFTSIYYGKFKSAAPIILENTRNAIEDFFSIDVARMMEIHSPKINSGLFGVPWEQTENIINDAIKGTDFRWIVWEL